LAKPAAQAEKPRLAAPAPRLVWIYVLLAIFLVGMMYGRNLSGDVWWHLKTGQWIIEHHAFPFTDPFSYTARNPIILHEWGAEVVEWLVYSRISPSALAAMAVLLICGAFVLTFRMALARSGRALTSFVVVAAGACASAAASEMRPQVCSFVFFALAVLILQRFHERGSRVLWLLAPLFLIWANFHGVFIAGLAMIALEVLVALLAPPEWALGRRLPRLASAGALAAVGAACALLALVSPNSTELYRYPIRVMANPETTRLINEWTAPTFQDWTGRSLLALLGMAAVGLASLRGRPALRDFAYVALFAAASLLSRRQAVLFSIACAAPIALWLSSARDEAALWLSKRRLHSIARRTAWAVLTILVLTLFVWRVSDARGRTAFDYMNTSEVFPAAACDFIQASRIAGPMFNDYNYGGYLIWRLWPEHRVFVDGRTEPFLQGTFEESKYASDCAGPGVWQAVFEKYGINFAVLNRAAALASVLAERSDWVRVYGDDKAIVFVRNIPANSAVIEAARGR